MAWPPTTHNDVQTEITSLRSGTMTVSGHKTFSDGLTSTSLTTPMRSTTWFGLGAGIGNARTPFYQNSLIDPAGFNNEVGVGGADDYVGQQTNVTFQAPTVSWASLIYARTGNMTSGSAVLTLTTGTFDLPIKVGYTVFVPGAGAAGATLKTTIATITNSTTATLNASASTTVTGAAVTASLVPDPTFLFGANDYIQTKSTTGALDGITDVYGRLSEIHINTPNSVLTNVKAFQTDGHIEASAAGSTVTNLFQIVLKAPRTAGSTVTNNYGILIDGTDGSPWGGTNTWAIYTKGTNPVRFGGRLDLLGDIRSGTTASFNISAGSVADNTSGSRLQLRANTADGYATLFLPQAAAKFQIHDGTANVFEFFRDTGLFIGRRGRFTGNAVADQVLTGRGVSGQTGDIFRVEDSNTNALFSVLAAGTVQMRNSTAPGSNNTAGGYLYVEGGALKYRGSSGTVTQIAAA